MAINLLSLHSQGGVFYITAIVNKMHIFSLHRPVDQSKAISIN